MTLTRYNDKGARQKGFQDTLQPIPCKTVTDKKQLVNKDGIREKWGKKKSFTLRRCQNLSVSVWPKFSLNGDAEFNLKSIVLHPLLKWEHG